MKIEDGGPGLYLSSLQDLVPLPLLTHGLRRGLRSVAALRLGIGGSVCALSPWVRACSTGAEARFIMMAFDAGLKACSTLLLHAALKRRCSTVVSALRYA